MSPRVRPLIPEVPLAASFCLRIADDGTTSTVAAGSEGGSGSTARGDGGPPAVFIDVLVAIGETGAVRGAEVT